MVVLGGWWFWGVGGFGDGGFGGLVVLESGGFEGVGFGRLVV